MTLIGNQEPAASKNSSDSCFMKSISESDSYSTTDGSKESVLNVTNEQDAATSTNALTKANSLSSAESALLQDPVWRGHKKHIFILSEAGKPIYSLHGSEDKLAILFGIIQALVSFVENTQDVLTSIHARGIQFVFMIKSHLVFVAASRTNMSVAQLQLQLK